MLQRKFDQVIRTYYPEALDAKDTSIRYMGKMQEEYGIDISGVLMATSLCSDDINIPSTSFFSVLFGPFIMGGLGGLPFAGKTGMMAFAHHIPDGGSAFFFYRHIGVTIDGKLGKMYRPRQENPGNSCGALMLALDRFRADSSYRPSLSEDDYQQMMLETSLLPFRDQVLAAENQEQAITEATFKVIDRKLLEYLKATKDEFHVEHVALLGGIIINTDYGMDDYFAMRRFEVLQVKDL